MTVHLLSPIIMVRFPTQTQRILAAILADYASPDGSGIYPAIDTLGDLVGADRRTIQRTMRLFEEIGLITLTKQGGQNGKGANEWKMNAELVDDLKWKRVFIEGDSTELRLVDNPEARGGAHAAPGRSPVPEGAVPVSQGGGAHAAQTVKEPSIEPNARARASNGSHAAPAVEKPVPSLPVTKKDGQWSAWLAYLREKGLDGIERAALRDGEILVSSRWPKPGVEIHTKPIAEPASNANRIIGEGK
jgi:hypothetical protein